MQAIDEGKLHFSMARSIDAVGVEDDTLLLMLGVLNLTALFLYSVYHHVQDSPRQRKAHNDYVSAHVTRVLDDLVMRAHTSNYYAKQLHGGSSGRHLIVQPMERLQKAVMTASERPLGSFDVWHMVRVVAGFPVSGSPVKQERWLIESMMGRSHLNSLPPDSLAFSVVKLLIDTARSWLSRTTNPAEWIVGSLWEFISSANALLKYPYNLIAAKNTTNVRSFNDKWSLNAPSSVKRWISSGSHRQESSFHETSTSHQIDSDVAGHDLPGTHWTDRWYRLTGEVSPVLADLSEVYSLSRRRSQCLTASVCRFNEDWSRSEAVRASLAPLSSLLLGWWLHDIGHASLEDLLVAIRTGWSQTGGCAQIYWQHCSLSPTPPHANVRIDTNHQTSTEIPVTTTATTEQTNTMNYRTSTRKYFWGFTARPKAPQKNRSEKTDIKNEDSVSNTALEERTNIGMGNTKINLPEVNDQQSNANKELFPSNTHTLPTADHGVDQELEINNVLDLNRDRNEIPYDTFPDKDHYDRFNDEQGLLNIHEKEYMSAILGQNTPQQHQFSSVDASNTIRIQKDSLSPSEGQTEPISVWNKIFTSKANRLTNKEDQETEKEKDIFLTDASSNDPGSNQRTQITYNNQLKRSEHLLIPGLPRSDDSLPGKYELNKQLNDRTKLVSRLGVQTDENVISQLNNKYFTSLNSLDDPRQTASNKQIADKSWRQDSVPVQYSVFPTQAVAHRPSVASTSNATGELHRKTVSYVTAHPDREKSVFDQSIHGYWPGSVWQDSNIKPTLKTNKPNMNKRYKKFRIGLRRGLPSGGVHRILKPANGEYTDQLKQGNYISGRPDVSTTSTSLWSPTTESASKHWVRFQPYDGITDVDRHRQLYQYVRDRSVRHLL